MEDDTGLDGGTNITKLPGNECRLGEIGPGGNVKGGIQTGRMNQAFDPSCA